MLDDFVIKSDLEVGKLANNPVSLVEQINSLQICMHRASKIVRSSNRCVPPKTLQHKIVVVSSFVRSLGLGKHEHCQALQEIYEALRCVPLVSWKESQGFRDLRTHFNDLQHQVTFERAKTHTKEDDEQGFVEFGGIGTAYSTLY